MSRRRFLPEEKEFEFVNFYHVSGSSIVNIQALECHYCVILYLR